MISRGLVATSLVLLVLPLTASAQSLMSVDPYSISVSPQNPVPFGQVVLTPISGSVDLSNATMQVTANAKEVYRGSAKAVAIALGGGGVPTIIKVTVTSAGATYPQTLTIRPQDVVLVAEPVASAPALYPGRPLVPLEGTVRVVAMANLKDAKGVALNPATLSYSWRVDDTRISASSGIGKDTIMVASPLQYRSREVTVDIQSQDGTLVGGAELSLSPEVPTVRLYESDPLLGIMFDRAVTNTYNIAGAEKTFYGAPYSFPLRGGVPILRWFLNGASAQTGGTITLRPAGSGTGTAALSLVASGGESTTATKKVSITFGAARGGFGIFGL